MSSLALAIASLSLVFPGSQTGESPAPWRVDGKGTVHDSTHPERPDDEWVRPASLRIAGDPEVGEHEIAVVLGDGGAAATRTWFERRGRVFQIDAKGAELAPASLGDLEPAVIAALHPRLVRTAMDERREALARLDDERVLLAWNDALWTVTTDAAGERPVRLERRRAHELHGDLVEVVRYEDWPADQADPGEVVVTQGDREIARFALTPARPATAPEVPPGDPTRDAFHALATRDVELREVAPHLFTLDLVALDTRVVVAEFSDHLAVLEGAHSSRVTAAIARALDARFAKPVRYFAFSHIHPQYVGGLRTWVHSGATVLCPPATVPLVQRMASAPFTLLPDDLHRAPRPAQVRTVERALTLADDVNELVLHSVVSGHTDEYLLFHFPRQRVLLSGDLLFLVPGEPLRARSKHFCDTVEALELDFERVLCTWPMNDAYGTKNVVTREELLAARAASD